MARLAGEVGVCGIGLPQVALRTLHPAPPESYTIFMAGCNFRCLYCQNWDIAHEAVAAARKSVAVQSNHITPVAAPERAQLAGGKLG